MILNEPPQSTSHYYTNVMYCMYIIVSFRSDPDRDRWVDVLKETISRNDKKRDTLQLDGELTIVKDPHIKSVVETMSVSPTLLRKKSVRRKFSMRRKAIRKSQLDSDEVDSGNSSDVSLELFCGDRRSADLDVRF